MGLRLSSDLSDAPQAQNGFDVSGADGKEYNLDQIEANKNRRANNSPLAVYRTTTKHDKAGSLSMEDTAKSLNMSNFEYENILLEDEKTQQAGTINYDGLNQVTLTRPVVIWENGTEDERIDPETKTAYDEIYELETVIERLNNELNAHKESITNAIRTDITGRLITRRDAIPTVGAIFDYFAAFRDMVKYDYIDKDKLGLRNGTMSMNLDGTYKATLSDSGNFSFRADETIENYYTLVIGGRNG